MGLCIFVAVQPTYADCICKFYLLPVDVGLIVHRRVIGCRLPGARPFPRWSCSSWYELYFLQFAKVGPALWWHVSMRRNIAACCWKCLKDLRSQSKETQESRRLFEHSLVAKVFGEFARFSDFSCNHRVLRELLYHGLTYVWVGRLDIKWVCPCGRTWNVAPARSRILQSFCSFSLFISNAWEQATIFAGHSLSFLMI